MSTSPKPFVFVLMPFESALDDLFNHGIKGACESVGAYCERLDDQIFQENMLHRIYNEIAKADIVVAEMTGRNPNVFYEVGYAHALGKRVVLMTQSARDIPFDLQQYFHIIHGNRIDDARAALERHLRWYIEHPENQTPEALVDLQVCLSGQLLSTETPLPVKRCELPPYRSLDGLPVIRGRQFLRFDFTAHNLAESRIQTLQFSPQLITTDSYTDFADPNATDIKPLPSARLPGGKAAHRFPSLVVVEPGGSATFSLALFPAHSGKESWQDDAVLRLLGDHPAIDKNFRFAVPQPEQH
jgi:hypothetical protein